MSKQEFSGEIIHTPKWKFAKEVLDEMVNEVLFFYKDGFVEFHWNNVAKRRLDIPIDVYVIPEELTKKYNTIIEQLIDARYEIKEIIETRLGRSLVSISADGRSARKNGGAPVAGLALRNSIAGTEDSVLQIKMAHGALKRATVRSSDQLPENIRGALFRGMGIVDTAIQGLPPAPEEEVSIVDTAIQGLPPAPEEEVSIVDTAIQGLPPAPEEEA